MADIVGTAYVRIRAVTTGLGKDIKDGIESGLDFDAIGKKMSANLNKASKKAGDDSGKTIATRMRESFRKSMDKDGGKSFINTLNKNLKKIKIPGKAWLVALGIPAFGGALKIAGAYVITLIGQLGFLVTAAVGAGAALAGAIGLGLIGIAPLILAFKTETEALDKFKESLEEQADAWKEVGAAMQDGFLQPLTEATQLLSREFIPLFGDLAADLGDVFGDIALDIAEVLTSSSAMESWASVFENVAPFFEAIGGALTQVARLLPPLLEVTAPLAVDLAEAIERAATNFANFITAGASSGELGTNLTIWWERAKLVGEVLWNLVEALWEIFRVGADVVSPQFENLRDITQGWVDGLRSASGQEGLQNIFENALPVAQEVNRLLEDIIEMIAEPILGGDTEGIISFLESLREDWLPIIGEVAEVLGDTLAGPLREFIDVVLDLIVAMSESGALGVFLDVMVEILEVFMELLEIPGFGTFIGYVLAAFAAFSALMTVIGPLLTAVSVLAGLIGLGPALAVVAAVVIQLMELFFLIKNWDKIVDFFKNIWTAITEFFGGIGEWFGELWDTISEFFGNIPDLVAEGAEALWTWIEDAAINALRAIGRFVGGIVSWIVSLPGKLVTWLAQAAVALFNWIIDAIPQALYWLGRLVGQILGFILLMPIRIGLILIEGAVALWNWIKEAVPQALKWMLNLIGTVMNFIIGLPGRLISLLVKATLALWDWIKKAVPKVVEWLGTIWKKITGWFTETLPKLITRGAEMLTNFLKWIVDAIADIPGKLADFAQEIWDWAVDFIADLPEKFAGALDAALQLGEDIVNAIVDGLGNAWDTVWDWGGEFINGIIDGILDMAGPLRGLLSGLLGRGGSTSGGGGGTGGGGANQQSFGFQQQLSAFSAIGRAGTPLALAGAGSAASAALTSTPTSASGINLVVQIGERDITDIVDARISDNDMATAHSLFVTRR